MSIACPYCKHTINTGATVCSACHAFKSNQLRQNGAIGLFYLAAMLTYLAYGPGVLLYGIFGKFSWGIILTGIVTSTVGWFVLWGMNKMATRPMWYRRY